MPDNLHTLQWTDEDYAKAAKQWGRQFLLMPIIGAAKTLQYMTPVPGIRYKLALPTIEGKGQYAPYKADRKAAESTTIGFRELETQLGNLRIDFEPNLYARMVLGRAAPTLGDGQAQAPTVKHVIASVMQDVDQNLNYALFDAVYNPAGNTTKDMFNGWGTILNSEISQGNITEDKGNLLKIQKSSITAASAVDIAKEIDRSCHPTLRDRDKYLFCDPDFADKYNDGYLLTHSGIAYNTKFNQFYVEGSNNKTTIVPLDCLAGTDKYIVTTKSNMLYGFDTMSDETRFEIKRFQPWVLTIAAAMFFGTQFYSIDQRFLKVVKLEQ